MEGVKEDGPAPPPAAFVGSTSSSDDEKVDDEKDHAAAEAVEGRQSAAGYCCSRWPGHPDAH